MRVLFCGKTFAGIADLLREPFAAHETRIGEDWQDHLPWAEVIVIPPLPVDAALLARAPKLKLIHQWGAGVDHVDFEEIRKSGLAFCNVPSRGTGNAEGVAETALLLALLLARRFFRSQQNLVLGRLYAPQGVAMWRKKAAVVGLGQLGRCLVERLQGLGMDVVGVNRETPADLDGWGALSFFPLRRLHEALAGCRFVFPALALNAETEGLFDAKTLRAMDEGSYLINVARAGLIRREALEAALDAGHLAGAGLDVFWDEPVSPDDPLLARPDVIVTPHIGGVTDGAVAGIASFIGANVDRLAAGKPLLSRRDGGDVP
ncbi:MAG: glyoxylate reductase [Synergistaceae bacterium]|nr:glyoxylate reductase [Synergistaceae bacterium]